MRKTNCWEYLNCGRGPGANAGQPWGPCPAASERRAHGVNGGRNGGRACWALAGSFSGRGVCGTLAAKISDCMDCSFFGLVGSEEGSDYMGAKAIFARIHMHHPSHARSTRPHLIHRIAR